ncbi:hypothetical protein QBC37DRAFT_394342 [Rhypophila decipiens]|uniref:Uncharacterized protein n=1 Tax=Rhypophila decipiens TaxID=261697 RepID=A0AAN6YLF6_9PEZI|nr:hypothetical protein QBC37DRAFT_394342 [Rhypophila decipiens]
MAHPGKGITVTLPQQISIPFLRLRSKSQRLIKTQEAHNGEGFDIEGSEAGSEMLSLLTVSENYTSRLKFNRRNMSKGVVEWKASRKGAGWCEWSLTGRRDNSPTMGKVVTFSLNFPFPPAADGLLSIYLTPGRCYNAELWSESANESFSEPNHAVVFVFQDSPNPSTMDVHVVPLSCSSPQVRIGTYRRSCYDMWVPRLFRYGIYSYSHRYPGLCGTMISERREIPGQWNEGEVAFIASEVCPAEINTWKCESFDWGWPVARLFTDINLAGSWK